MDEGATSFDRRDLLTKIKLKNEDFDRQAREATQTKANLRNQMADMEDKLRKLRDRKNELDIDNRNLEMIVNTESGLR